MHVDHEIDAPGTEAQLDAAPPAVRAPVIAPAAVPPPLPARGRVVTKRSSRPARAITHTPLSMVFPEGFRLPDLPPDNPHVISGRALLEGKEPEPLLDDAVNDELKELDDPIEFNAPSSAASKPTMKVPGRAEQGAVVLLVGTGFPQEDALIDALGRHHVHIESAKLETVVETVATTSPDLIVIAGDASEHTGERVLEVLRRSPLSSNVPAAILCADPSLDDRFEAYRHGATALIRQSASPDQTADRIATLAGRIVRHEHLVGPGSEAMLSELVGAVSAQIKATLTPSANATSDSNVRLLMHTERDVSRLIDGFAMRLARHVTPMKTVEYELGAALQDAEMLGPERTAEALSMPDIEGVRLIIADDDPTRADAIAQQLRAHGAVVAITQLDPSPEVFEQLRQSDPVAIVMGSTQAEREARGLLRSARSDARLRWAAARVMDWAELSTMPGGLGRILGLVAAAAEPEERIREHLVDGSSCDMRLESLGPPRLLRTLAALPFSSRVSLYNRRLRVRVDVAEGLIVGAEGETYDGVGTQSLDGPAAIAALFVVTSGRIHVERTASPSKVNVMSPVDVALALADADTSPIVPSNMLPKALSSKPGRETLPTLSERLEPTSRDTLLGPSSRADFTMNQPVVARARRSWLSLLGLGLTLILIGLWWQDWATRLDATLRRASAPSAPALARAASHAARAPEGLTTRATRRDAKALAEPEARPAEGRDVEQLLALAKGQLASKRSSVVALGEQLARQPSLGAQRETWIELRNAARDPVVYPEALEVIASLPGGAGADVLYDVWVGTAERNPGTKLAEQLLYTEPVRQNASPALGVALDLRKVKSCEQLVPLLRRATESADQRSLHLLVRLGDPKRCNRGSYECRCVLGNAELRRAINAAKKRPGPSFERGP